MLEVKYTRVYRESDNEFFVQYSGNGEEWLRDDAGPFAIPIDAATHAKQTYPDAEYIGTFPKRKVPYSH